jgi:hypothetical protein
MATGRVLRTWTAPAPRTPGAGIAPANTQELAWSADGRTLSFRDPRSDGASSKVPPNLRTLDVRSPGNDLIADSRGIPFRGKSRNCLTLQLAPDGQSMICGTMYIHQFGRGNAGPEFDAFSAMTGKLARVLYRYPGPDSSGAAYVLWVGSGSTAIGLIQVELNSSKSSEVGLLPVLLTSHGATPLHIKLAGVPLPVGWIAF